MTNSREQPRKYPVKVYLYRAEPSSAEMARRKDERIVIVSNGRSTAAEIAPLKNIDAVSARLKAEVERMEQQRREGMVRL